MVQEFVEWFGAFTPAVSVNVTAEPPQPPPVPIASIGYASAQTICHATVSLLRAPDGFSGATAQLMHGTKKLGTADPTPDKNGYYGPRTASDVLEGEMLSVVWTKGSQRIVQELGPAKCR